MLIRVHLTGEASGDAPQLVAANPNSTVADFQAMVAERLADEYGLAEVEVTSLRSMEGVPLRCGAQATVRQLVAEAGCVLSASISHPVPSLASRSDRWGQSGLDLASLRAGQAEVDGPGSPRPQLFGKPSIALQIYQKNKAGSDQPDEAKLLLVGPERLYHIEGGELTAGATHQLGPAVAAALLEGTVAVAAAQSSLVSFMPTGPAEEPTTPVARVNALDRGFWGNPEQCELGQPASGLFRVWDGALVAVGVRGALFSVDPREARQLVALPGVDHRTVSCSDGRIVSYVTFDPEADQPAQLWQVGSDLRPQLRASASLPQPRAVVAHNGSIFIFASGLYKMGSDSVIRPVQLSGPDAFIAHSVTCAVSGGSGMFAVSGADADELWEVSKEGTCSFVCQIPTSIKVIVHER